MNGPVWDNKGLCHVGIRNFAISTMLYKMCVIRFYWENINPSVEKKKNKNPRKRSSFLTFGGGLKLQRKVCDLCLKVPTGAVATAAIIMKLVCF